MASNVARRWHVLGLYRRVLREVQALPSEPTRPGRSLKEAAAQATRDRFRSARAADAATAQTLVSYAEREIAALRMLRRGDLANKVRVRHLPRDAFPCVSHLVGPLLAGLLFFHVVKFKIRTSYSQPAADEMPSTRRLRIEHQLSTSNQVKVSRFDIRRILGNAGGKKASM